MLLLMGRRAHAHVMCGDGAVGTTSLMFRERSVPIWRNLLTRVAVRVGHGA